MRVVFTRFNCSGHRGARSLYARSSSPGVASIGWLPLSTFVERSVEMMEFDKNSTHFANLLVGASSVAIETRAAAVTIS